MSAVLTNPADIVNAALGRIGYKRRLGSLYDGSEQSARALDIYGQTRDAKLREFDWGFAERDVALTLLKTAPAGGYTPPLVWSSTYPILPWKYEYAYPDDMLKLRSLRTTPVFIPEYDPVPIVFRIANDNSYTPAQKVILTDLPAAVCVYTGQVIDPTTWEPDFTESLIAALGKRLAPVLTSLDAVKMEAQDEVVTQQMAEMRLG